jgi:hypothetical protein
MAEVILPRRIVANAIRRPQIQQQAAKGIACSQVAQPAMFGLQGGRISDALYHQTGWLLEALV